MKWNFSLAVAAWSLLACMPAMGEATQTVNQPVSAPASAASAAVRSAQAGLVASSISEPPLAAVGGLALAGLALKARGRKHGPSKSRPSKR